MTQKKVDNEQLQNVYVQLQLIENQLVEIQEQVIQVENKKQEILNLQEGLKEIGKSKSNINSFSQIGLGIYAKSKILDTKKLIVNVGADLFVEKNVNDISKILKKQFVQFKDLSKNLTQNYQILTIQAQAMQAQLQEGIKE